MKTRIITLSIVAALTACSAQASRHRSVGLETACGQRAVQLIAQNVDTITARRYGAASAAAERAARVSLACAATDRTVQERFSDRWRGANALVVAAELAHQAAQPQRAKRLLVEGYRIMHELQPPTKMSTLTSALVSQTRDGAERDLRGQWSYW